MTDFTHESLDRNPRPLSEIEKKRHWDVWEGANLAILSIQKNHISNEEITATSDSDETMAEVIAIYDPIKKRKDLDKIQILNFATNIADPAEVLKRQFSTEEERAA